MFLSGALVERERELAHIDRVVEQLGVSLGAVMVVEGAPGTGKTRLLGALVEAASTAGFAVAATRAVDLDAVVPLAVVRRLMRRSLRVAGGEQDAWELAAPEPAAGGSSALLAEGALGAAVAVVSGVEALVDSGGPLVVAVDDAQWADAVSLEVLGHLADRARELPLVLAVAVRPGEVEHERLARLRVTAGAVVLRPRELSTTGVAAVIAARFSDAPAKVVDACRRVSGGNPFLLHELLGDLAEAEPLTDRWVADRIERLAPRTVIDAVVVRLGRLPPGAAALARGLAVLGDRTRLRHAAGLAGLDLEEAVRSADALIADDVLVGEERLSFRHPLIAAAIREDISRFRRAVLHRRAAGLLADAGEHDRAAAHLLSAEAMSDSWVVATLRAAAGRAAARGDAIAARRLLQRALEEPPDDAVRGELLVELARAETAIGDIRAVEHLDAAIAGLRDGRQAAQALRAVARLHYVRTDYAAATRLAERGLELVEVDDPAHDRLRATWMLAAGLNPPTIQRCRAATDVLVSAVEAGSPPDDPELKAIASLALISRFGRPQVVATLARAAIEGDLQRNDDGLVPALDYALGAMLFAGALRDLESVASDALVWVRRRGSLLAAASVAVWRGLGRLRRGDLDGAEADATVALTPWRYGWTANTQQACAILAQVRLERGDPAGAQEAIVAAAGIELPHPPYELAAGQVRLANGDSEGALERCLAAGALLESVWATQTSAVLPWRSHAALAALAAEQRSQAETYAAAELDLARRAGVAAALAAALRCVGLVEGGEAGIRRLREAVALLESDDAQLEAVRTQVELGAALRRAGERAAAREELAAAREHAERLGLPALAARAAEEHRASGGRLRRERVSGVAALTPSEWRVAERAAAGSGNRRIAGELFLTVKTVEWHLSNIFRKLDLTSRHELARALADEPPDR